MTFKAAGSLKNHTGTFSDPCHSGTYRDSSMLECKKCPANTYSTEGAGLCIACPQGSAASEDGIKCGIVAFLVY